MGETFYNKIKQILPLFGFSQNASYFCRVKKYIAILFIGIHLFTSTELHQLAKLPVFISHYFEHQTQNPQLSLLEFVALHYFNGDVHDEDYAEDMKLPFKQTCIEHALVYVPLFQSISITKSIEIPTQVSWFYRQDKQLSSFISDIWNPPRA